MSLYNIKVDIDKPANLWHEALVNAQPQNDYIIFHENIDNLIWFITNYTQFLSRQGNNEIIPLYGNEIENLQKFIYQINLCLPVGYKLSTNLHALHDLLLNFETEPICRFVIWNDADYLFCKNKIDFVDIFEQLIISAYCNRNAIATVKKDGVSYQVDQRNIFCFNKFKLSDIEFLLEKAYFIPSIFESDLYKKLDFNIIDLVR